MPLALELADPSTFVVQASGGVAYDEVKQLIGELQAHSQFSPGMRILVDGRTVSEPPSAAELRLLAGELKPLLDRGLGAIAIVAESAPVYAAARMFGVFAQTVYARVGTFRDIDEGRRWLIAQQPLPDRQRFSVRSNPVRRFLILSNRYPCFCTCNSGGMHFGGKSP